LAASWIDRKVEEDANVLYLTGVWRLPNVAAISHALRAMQVRDQKSCKPAKRNTDFHRGILTNARNDELLRVGRNRTTAGLGE